MKNLLKSFTLIAMMIMVPVICQAQANPNFSGSWTPNAEKSKLPAPPAGGGGGFGGGGGMRMGGGDLVIKQEANLITIETTRQGRDGAPTTTTAKYTLDGKESVNAGGFGGDQKSTATWSADGKTLKISTTMDFGQGPNTSVVEWYMTDGILYQKRTMPSFDGGAEQTIINAYNKK